MYAPLFSSKNIDGFHQGAAIPRPCCFEPSPPPMLLFAVSPPFPVDLLPHDLHCASKVSTNDLNEWEDVSMSADVSGSGGCENSTKRSSDYSDQPDPPACTLACGGYYADDVTSNHRYEVDFAQPTLETDCPDEARQPASVSRKR